MLPVSLPIVVIFERHWDVEPKQIVKSLIPKLAQEGYDTLCFEAPQNLTERQILASQRENLKLDSEINSQAARYLQRAGMQNSHLSDIDFGRLAELMRLYVSSKNYIEVAEKIKGLPASLLFKDITESAMRFSLALKGVDIDDKDFSKMVSTTLSERMRIIEKNEAHRMTTISENLFKLFNEGKGVIFVCGALHAENLMNKFKEKNIEDRVLYYFPHSDKNYGDTHDDVNDLMSDTLNNHTFRLLGENDRQSLIGRIVKEVKAKNTEYKNEILGGNSQSALLSSFFHKDFKAFMRPGFYVDALLNIDETDDPEMVANKLHQVDILTHNTSLFGTRYLVVKDVNTPEVSLKLMEARFDSTV